MSFIKALATTVCLSSLLATPVLAQSSTTGGGAEGSMSSANGGSEGSMSGGSMMSKSHMMKKKHHMMKKHTMMKNSGGM